MSNPAEQAATDRVRRKRATRLAETAAARGFAGAGFGYKVLAPLPELEQSQPNPLLLFDPSITAERIINDLLPTLTANGFSVRNVEFRDASTGELVQRGMPIIEYVGTDHEGERIIESIHYVKRGSRVGSTHRIESGRDD
jgi:hypothetical protein